MGWCVEEFTCLEEMEQLLNGLRRFCQWRGRSGPSILCNVTVSVEITLTNHIHELDCNLRTDCTFLELTLLYSLTLQKMHTCKRKTINPVRKYVMFFNSS